MGSSVWPINWYHHQFDLLIGIITLCQSEPGSNDNEVFFHILLSSSIEASLSCSVMFLDPYIVKLLSNRQQLFPKNVCSIHNLRILPEIIPPHSIKRQDWSLTIWWFSVISRILVGWFLSLCRDAVDVLYTPSQLGSNMKHNLAAWEVFAWVVNKMNHTGSWDNEFTWYCLSATWICLYGLRIYCIRPTWPCLIVEVLATRAEFLEPSVTCAFTFCCTINVFGCF